MKQYPSSIIMLSFALLNSMFAPMIMIVMFALCSVCSMVYMGKNISNCRKPPQFLPEICALRTNDPLTCFTPESQFPLGVCRIHALSYRRYRSYRRCWWASWGCVPQPSKCATANVCSGEAYCGDAQLRYDGWREIGLAPYSPSWRGQHHVIAGEHRVTTGDGALQQEAEDTGRYQCADHLAAGWCLSSWFLFFFFIAECLAGRWRVPFFGQRCQLEASGRIACRLLSSSVQHVFSYVLWIWGCHPLGSFVV